MHLSAVSHVCKNSSAFVVRSVQMHLTTVRLNWNVLKYPLDVFKNQPNEEKIFFMSFAKCIFKLIQQKLVSKICNPYQVFK